MWPAQAKKHFLTHCSTRMQLCEISPLLLKRHSDDLPVSSRRTHKLSGRHVRISGMFSFMTIQESILNWFEL